MKELITRLEQQTVEIYQLKNTLDMQARTITLYRTKLETAEKALQVITSTRHILDYLLKNDPKALEQAQNCLI